LVAWARERMSDYKAPRKVVFVDELPRTGTDKVQKSELRDLFEEAKD
jgi:acyl-coenzyme A synthetase/AMP-(fatty) acid ligase